MTKSDLIAYMEHVIELELAIYKYEKIRGEHIGRLYRQEIAKPVERHAIQPDCPKKSDYTIDKQIMSFCVPLWIPWLFIVSGVILCFLWMWGVGVTFAILGGTLLAFIIPKQKEEKEKQIKLDAEYEKAKEEYKKQLDHYYYVKMMLKEEYERSVKKYELELKEKEANIDKVSDRYHDAYWKVWTALTDAYGQGVIFPKYRNLVAVTTMHEYLVSGRCSTLEGPFGAYNLYESELRQNLIIEQLVNINRNLEAIRNNQYALYTELTRANAYIRNMNYELQGIHSELKLNNYLTEMIALAENSPKIIHGMIL